MLISQGAARTARVNLDLACSLAAIAGALNAAAFYAVGFFSANMTGNVSALSDHVGTAQWSSGAFFLAIVLIFVAGSTVSSLLINAGRRRGMATIYAYSILTEAILLACLGLADLWFAGSYRDPLLVLGLAFLMGIQNATVTRISETRVRTTHVSGMVTDIGIELGIAIDILRGKEARIHADENRSRLKLHVYAVGCFLVGGILGVVLYRAVDGYLLLLCAAALLVIAIRGIGQGRGKFADRRVRDGNPEDRKG